MENHTDHPLTLTVEQTAKLLGIGRSTAHELVHTGDIPSLRLGRRIVVPAARLAALLNTTASGVQAGEADRPTATHPSDLAREREAVESLRLFWRGQNATLVVYRVGGQQ
jgi:excisionase family DNA binding protein